MNISLVLFISVVCSDGTNSSTSYELHSLICHIGHETDRGHYYSYVKKSKEDLTRYNDTQVVHNLKSEQVLEITAILRKNVLIRSFKLLECCEKTKIRCGSEACIEVMRN